MFSYQNSVCIAVLSSACCMPHHHSPSDEYKLWLSSVYSFLQSLMGSSVLSTLLCYSVNPISFLFQNNIKNGIYPAPLQSLWAIVAILAAMHFAKHGMVHTCINAILVLMPGYVFAHPTHFANNCNFVILSLKLKECKIGNHSHAWVFACVSEGTGWECGCAVDGSLLSVWKCTHMVFFLYIFAGWCTEQSTQAKCTIGICPLNTYLA